MDEEVNNKLYYLFKNRLKKALLHLEFILSAFNYSFSKVKKVFVTSIRFFKYFIEITKDLIVLIIYVFI